MKKAVIFDLDDTLISEDEYIKSGYKAVAWFLKDMYGWDERMTCRQLYDLYLEDSRNVFNRLMEAHDIRYKDNEIMELVEVYREHKPDISFYPDVKPCLYALKDRGIRLGLLSDGYAVAQRKKLTVLGVNGKKIFDKIIITDELGRDYWKPDPRPFIMMKEAFHIDWKDMVYVGDNPEKDFFIGRDFPIMTIRIMREKSVYKDRLYKEGYRESARLNSLADLIKVIS
ncbi:MAG: HAD hydrolase-like protein [Lachnospiraceae bacterium]|nr:HAD hydrolase-like protein [Lachnospiraceae bacterium]